MLGSINDEDNPRSSLNWWVNVNHDENMDWIVRNVPDPTLGLIMLGKYKSIRSSSVSYSALRHDMVQKVLPTVAKYIDERFYFAP